ncbi:MAG: peptide methionine sulfoxide reductase [Nocardioidaceae bacterium]|nr:peptide methionine sulfoxide reductase [Nocardioidaceae bacterium]
MRSEPEQARPTLAWLALAVVYVVWGSTYLAIRVGVRDLPPGILAGSRYLLAGLMLYPVAVRSGSEQLRRTDRPRRRQWLACAVVGVLLLVMGNGGVTFAERTVPSGLTAVLVATVPLWMVVFGVLIDRNRVTAASALGLVVGLVGVAVLAGGGPLRGHWVGLCIVLAASASWGLGSVVGHHLGLPRRALLAAAMQMLVAGGVLLTVAAVSGELGEVRWTAVSVESWLALLWLIVPGSILAFTAYGYSLAHLPITTVSTYAYVNPVVAVALGAALLGETFGPREILGTGLVVFSVALTMHRALPEVVAPVEVPRLSERAG